MNNDSNNPNGSQKIFSVFGDRLLEDLRHFWIFKRDGTTNPIDEPINVLPVPENCSTKFQGDGPKNDNLSG